MNVMSNYSVTSADLMGLPSYMADGELVNGRVETSCKLHAAIPGVPNMCFKVVPGFLHALNALATNTAAYGKNNTAYMAEVTNNGVRYAAAFKNSNASIHSCANGKAVTKDKVPTSLPFLLSMPFYMEDKEFSDSYEGWVNAQSDEERKRYIATMFDNAYQRNGANNVIAAWDTKNLLGLTDSKLSQFDVSDGIGDFTVFKNGNTANAANSAVAAMAQSVMDGSAFNGAYRIVEESELTAEEKEHVFHIDDRFIVTRQHEDVCQTIQKSMSTAHPFSNYLLRGAPGGGKSTFVQIIAAGTGLPYYSDVLRDDITADFFSGYYAPDCDRVGKHIGLDEFIANMPSPEDMAYDPVDAFERITGSINEEATANDCMNALMARVKEITENSKGESQQVLTFVEGLVPKLTRPCLVFYDEVTVPKNPGVIAALNTLMDNQRKFTLTSGKVIERHPKSVMMFAGNFDDVEGCREPNRAWQDRNNEILDVDPPTAEQMKQMLVAATGYNEKTDGNIPIDKFVAVWPELQKISAEYYGVCGPRALCDWLAKSMIIGSPIRAAETTIITKSSSDKTCQANMRMKIRNSFRF